MDVYNIVRINGIKINSKKNFATHFNPVFPILLIVKSFEAFPKHSA